MTTPTLLPPERLAEIKGRCDMARREWLVIENMAGRGVFAEDEDRNRKGYIPRDVVEGELGIKVEPDGRCTFFTRESGERMRAHPDWSDTEPPQSDISALLDHITALTRERDAEREARFKTDAALRMKDDAVNTLMERLARKHGDRCEDLIS